MVHPPHLTRNTHTHALSLLQRWGVEVAAAADEAIEEPLLLAVTMQQRLLQAADALSLQLPSTPITSRPPPPISLSGDLDPPPPISRSRPLPLECSPSKLLMCR